MIRNRFTIGKGLVRTPLTRKMKRVIVEKCIEGRWWRERPALTLELGDQHWERRDGDCRYIIL